MDAKKVRVAIYVRASTDKQEDSPERQLSTVLPYVERKAAEGYEVSGKYIDLNRKGWTDERPEFQRLLKDAAAGKVDIIAVDQGSRLSRQTPTEFFALVAYPLDQAKVKVGSVQRGRALDWNDIGDFIIQGVDQYRNHGESADTSWRVLSECCLKASQADWFPGPTPYGYVKATRPDGRKTLVPGDERQVQVIRYIFDAYGRLGLSVRQIRDELERRGASTPKGTVWRTSTITRWLRDPVYIGTYRYNVNHKGKFYRRTKEGLKPSDRPKGKGREQNPKQDGIVIPESHPPLIDITLFDRVQELLTLNKRNTTPSRENGDYLFTGLLVCADCGCRKTGIGRLRGLGAAYRCASAYETGRCRTNYVNEHELKAQVLKALQNFASPETLAEVRRRAQAILERLCQPTNLEPLKAEREKLTKQTERAKRNLALLETHEDVKAVQGRAV
jgi:site-specific DNA recombinase